MKTVKTSLLCIVFLGLVFLTSNTFAQKGKFNLPFRKSKPPVNTDEGLELRQDCGPWLIMCASFVDEDGERQARNLAQELRSKYNLKAYIYRHQFNLSESIQGLGWQLAENPSERPVAKRMKPARVTHFEEIAVLVGDFPTVEDNRAQKTLKQIKMLQPESLANFDPSRGSAQQLRYYREIVRQISTDSESKAKGPLCAAFLLPNPMLPDQYFAANKIDHFVINLNKKVKHSLLDNPGIYSVRVATFRGDSTFQIHEIEQKEKELNLLKRMGKSVKKSKLAEAAQKAHLLTEELRSNGVEAYEFHDRHESYVCVGSYDWISKTNPNGVDVNNPDIVKVINTLKASVENLPNLPGAVAPQVLPKFRKTDIVFDPQPIPVLVPKASTSTASRLKPWK